MSRVREIVSGAIAVALLVTTLVGCTPEPTPTGARPVTTEESQLLATVRFRNFDAGSRSIAAALTDTGTELGLTGWVDYRTGIGYAVLADTGVPTYLMLWNGDTVAAKPTDAVEAATVVVAPVVAPETLAGFEVAPLGPETALLSLLAILVELGNDRPENPLLLQQGGALWLREDAVGDTAVTVFAGPTTSDDAASTATNDVVDPEASGTRYWIDDNGLLLRFDVRLGADWVTVTFGPGEDVALTDVFTVAP